MTATLEVVLRRPVTAQPAAADFEVVERALPTPAAGQVLVRAVHLSLDPYIGSRLRGRQMGEPPPAPGQALPGSSVGEVIASQHPGVAKGEFVVGECGWTPFGLMDGDKVRKVDATLPLSAHLGVLGMPGLTAWAGVTQLAQVGPGDVFVVDAAAGPVGGTAGQIAKRLGARAVGVAGGAEKCALVRDTYGLDGCVDYRQPDWAETLKLQTDGGPTVHYENVGLSVLLPVMGMLRPYGRVVIGGMAEHYQADAPPPQMPVGLIVGKRARILGLVVYDYYPRWGEWLALAGPWIRDGELAFGEDVADGVQTAPAQFEKLMNGRNVGKSLVRMGPDRI